ncbi:MAG: hypothetical protein CMJ32_01695 [Phycisphaerae bacterium]|nr:hypothetical protein [Phycisphaerae bacterium]
MTTTTFTPGTTWSCTLVLVLVGLLGGCTMPKSYPNQDPTGQVFPTVTGENLDKEKVELPTAHLGRPVLYMVGYVQQTQFDLDRWAVGLVQVGFPCPIVEVPTIPGLVPSMFKGMIDNGMRSGIPAEDWASVVTLYGKQATPVARFTGTEGPRNGRLLLLDAEGVVQWFWDQGFSASRIVQLDQLARKLDASP